MKGSFRQSMAWLHTWFGLIVSWVLFAVFVTGTASYYRPEISRWMQPEMRQSEDLGPEALATAAERAVIYLQQHAQQSRAWFITLPTPKKPVTGLFWRNAPSQPPNIVLLDPADLTGWLWTGLIERIS